MEENKTLELEIIKIIPATVESNIDEIDKYMQSVEEKYDGWVVTEDEIKKGEEERTKLNKLWKNIGEVRKRIETEGLKDVKVIVEKLKEAERKAKNYSDFINNQ